MASKNKRLTMHDVAREAGVSQTTVSYVLSGGKHAARISPQTKQLVIRAAQRLGYRGNVLATALKRGYSSTIILMVVDQKMASVYADTIASLSRAALVYGLGTTVHLAADDDEAVSSLQNIPATKPFGLFLLWDSAINPTNHIYGLRSEGIPIVDLMPSMAKGIASVTTDREQGFRISTEHLIGLGHNKIGLILNTSTKWRTSTQKLNGYKQALEQAELKFDPELLQETDGIDFYAGKDGLLSLFMRRPDITAVMAINDWIALGAISASRELGLSVPGDLSICGFGDQREGTYFSPTVTSAGIPSDNIAQSAVETLLFLRDEPDASVKSLYEPMKLMVRESTGPARQR